VLISYLPLPGQVLSAIRVKGGYKIQRLLGLSDSRFGHALH